MHLRAHAKPAACHARSHRPLYQRSVVCNASSSRSSSPQPGSPASKPLPPSHALATDAPRPSSVQLPPASRQPERSRSHETDYVVVGSGIGGARLDGSCDVSHTTPATAAAADMCVSMGRGLQGSAAPHFWRAMGTA